MHDVERELAWAGGDPLRMILRGLLGNDEHVDAFVERYRAEAGGCDPDVARSGEKINKPLRDLPTPTPSLA
ncbi:hypothetical protein [Streptomyces chartreusis]|uniref:hypothetical protein n=1 Tax=Streptomyces chartreusis TaxID=1969 RepID=UPI003830892A